MGSWLSTYVDCTSLCLELVYFGLRWRATVQGFGELRQMMCMTWLCDRRPCPSALFTSLEASMQPPCVPIQLWCCPSPSGENLALVI